MDADYEPIKANKLISGQVLLDEGKERKIVRVNASPGRIYVIIQKDAKKAQLQYLPLDDVLVRKDKAQIFSTASPTIPSAETQLKYDLFAAPAPPFPEPASVNEAIQFRVPLPTSSYDKFLPKQLLDIEDPEFVVFSDRPEHNKTAVWIMRAGAIFVLVGILLLAFSMAARTFGVFITMGIFFSVVGGIVYLVGALVGFFNPPRRHGYHFGELVELTDAARDFDWGIIAPVMKMVSSSTQTADQPVVVDLLPQTMHTSTVKDTSAEVATMGRQQEQKAMSGAAPPVDMLSAAQAEKLSAHFTQQEHLYQDSSQRAARANDTDQSKIIDDEQEQVDMMGVIETMKSKNKQPEPEDYDEEQITRPF